LIVGLFGRKQVGKSTLADELVKLGFTGVLFAGYLKGLVCRLYELPHQWTTDEFLKEKILDNPLKFNEHHLSFIEKENNVHIMNREPKTFQTVRSALQYIGTDILRSIDPEFHVKKLASQLNLHQNYVVSDGRFPQEKLFLQSLGALCVFIIRPSLFISDNHESEISLSKNDFEYVLINNTNKDSFIRSFMEIFKTHFKNGIR